MFDFKYYDLIKLKTSAPDLRKTKFLVTYVDRFKVTLYDHKQDRQVELFFDKDGAITNRDDIYGVDLRERSEKEGYCANHGLDVGKTVGIKFFGVDEVFTGRIESTEGDVLEVLEVLEGDPGAEARRIWLPFEYRGMPAELNNIERIDVHDGKGDDADVDSPYGTDVDVDADSPYGTDADVAPTPPTGPTQVPSKDVASVLQSQIADADALVIEFGEDLEEREFFFEKTEADMRYSMDEQKLDIREGMLRERMQFNAAESADATVDVEAVSESGDVYSRTIERTIERFEHLHRKHSRLSADLLFEMREPRADDHRPMGEALRSLDMQKVPWIVPVVAARRRFYPREMDDVEDDRFHIASFEKDNVALHKLNKRQHELRSDVQGHGDETNFRADYLARLHKLLRHYYEYDAGHGTGCHRLRVASDGDVVMSNDDDFGSPVIRSTTKTEEVVTTRMVVYRPATGFRVVKALTTEEVEAMERGVQPESWLDRITREEREEEDERGKGQGQGSGAASRPRPQIRRVRRRKNGVFVEASPSDAVSVKSYMYMPMSVLAAFRRMSPNQNIASKTSAALDYPLKTLTVRRAVVPHSATYDGGPVDYRDIGENGDVHPTNIVANTDVRFDEDGFFEYADACAPTLSDAFALTSKHMPPRYSVHHLLLEVEALGFTNHNATHAPMMKMEQHVKRNIGEWRREYREVFHGSVALLQRDATTRSRRTARSTDAHLFSLPIFADEIPTYDLRLAEGPDQATGAGLWQDHEILHHVKARDCMRYMFAVLSRDNMGLYRPGLRDELFKELELLQERNRAAMGEPPARQCRDAKSASASTNILAKTYYSAKSVRADSQADAEVYFDQQHDPTRYDVYAEHEKAARLAANNDHDQMRAYMMRVNIEGAGLSDEAAYFEAESMLSGRRKVRDGDMAVLVLDASQRDRPDDAPDDAPDDSSSSSSSSSQRARRFFVRRAAAWVETDDMSPVVSLENRAVEACDLAKGCTATSSRSDAQTGPPITTCVPTDDLPAHMDERTMRDYVHSDAYDIQHTKDQYAKATDAIYERNRRRLLQRNAIRHVHMRLEDARGAEGEEGEEGDEGDEGAIEIERAYPPYVALRDAILSQADFIKKQRDLLKFCEMCTREARQDEDPFWLNCAHTGARILPLFLFRIAKSVVVDGDYTEVVKRLCQTQGQLSDRGDAWVDKHSGYFITYLAEDTHEGFKKDGRLNQTRDVIVDDKTGTRLEASSSSSSSGRTREVTDILSNIRGIDEMRETLDPKMLDVMRTVANVVSALYTTMGISDANARADIVLLVKNSIQTDLIYNQEAWEAEQKKKRDTREVKTQRVWKDELYRLVLLYTLGLVVVHITTAIPSHASNRSYMNCVAAFDGFPVAVGQTTSSANDADGDDERVRRDCLEYVCCITMNLKRSSTMPWSTIRKSTLASLRNNVRAVIERYVERNRSLQSLVYQKTKHLERLAQFRRKADARSPAGPDVGVGSELVDSNVRMMFASWPLFRPVLRPIKGDAPTELGEGFRKEYGNMLKRGDERSWEMLSLVRSKMTQYCVEIQRRMQQIIAQEKPLMVDANNEVYMENVCCLEGSNDAFAYLSAKDPHLSATLLPYVRFLHRTYLQTFRRFCRPNALSTHPALPVRRVQHDILDPAQNERAEEVLYETMIEHLNLERARPIPLDYLPVSAYQRKHSRLTPLQLSRLDGIRDKMSALQSDGMRFERPHIDALLKARARRTVFASRTDYDARAFAAVVEHHHAAARRIYDALRSEMVALGDQDVDDQAQTQTHIQPPDAMLQSTSGSVIDANILRLYMRMTDPSRSAEDRQHVHRNYVTYVQTVFRSRSTSLRQSLVRESSQRSANYKNTPTSRLYDTIMQMAVLSDETMASMFKAPADNDALGVSDASRVGYEAERYLIHAISCVSAILPSMVANRKTNASSFAEAPKYWGISSLHATHIHKYVSDVFKDLVALEKNPMCVWLVKRMHEDLKGVADFARGCVSHTSATTGVMDSATALLTLRFVFVSTMHYICVHLPENPSLREELKRAADLDEHLARVNVSATSAARSVASAFLTTVHRAHNIANHSYPEITAYVARLQQDDRLSITNRFKNLSDEERRLQAEMKRLRLGEWNVNVRNGVHVYNADVYDSEATDRHAAYTAEEMGEMSAANDTEFTRDIYHGEDRGVGTTLERATARARARAREGDTAAPHASEDDGFEEYSDEEEEGYDNGDNSDNDGPDLDD